MEINELLNKLSNVKKCGKYYTALCPAHNDKKNSLSIRKENDKILIYCHAGCDYNYILASIGLKARDLFLNNSTNTQTKVLECEYIYTDIEGKPLYKVMRYKPKDFRQAKYKNNMWIYNMEGAKYVPYNLTEVIKSDTIFWVEGEKDVENLRLLDLTATTTCKGANGFIKNHKEYINYFCNKKVYIIPDNDDAGLKYATDIKSKLKEIASYVGIIMLKDEIPNLKRGGDISDVIQVYGEEKSKKIIAKLLEKESENNTVFNILEKLKKLKPEYKYAKDNIGDAQMFYDVFSDIIIYDTTYKEWRIYDGTSWKLDSSSLIACKLLKCLKSALNLYIKDVRDESFIAHIKSLGNKKNRDTILKDAMDIKFVKSDIFDTNRNILNCKNGTLDLNTGNFTKHYAKDYISKIANVEYVPEASYDIFEKFINDIFEGNKEKIKFVQKIMGYSLSGWTNEEKAFILYGKTTRNGKSTLVETISTLLGDYASASQPEILTEKKFKDSRQASGDIARLKGARFVSLSEPSQKMILDIALLKTLTGNDKIVARALYKNEMEFYPQFKIFINTNYLPLINDPTIFSSNRLIVITFNKHFSEAEQDNTLKDKLKQSNVLSGVLNWCLEGLKLYQKEGLTIPQCIKDDIMEYKINSDKVELFINECLVESEENLKITDVYLAYTEWCDTEGIVAEKKTTFSKKLKEKGLIRDNGKIKEFKNGVWKSNSYKDVVYHKKLV